MRRLRFVMVAVLVALGACHREPLVVRRSSAIVNGTRDPQTVALTEGEILALGWLHPTGSPHDPFCTGTVIAPRVVVTASHCTSGSGASSVGFGIGVDPDHPDHVFDLDELYEHPSRDAALLVLATDATGFGVTPISANDQGLSVDLIGDAVQVGGYGETESAESGRFFATVYVEDIDDVDVVINGRGEQGICFGDSGGPLISLIEGAPAVLAVEAWGDPTCRYREHMTRLDLLTEWIAPVLTGEPPVSSGECDGLDEFGRCDGDIAEWCVDGVFRELDCASFDAECGYIDDTVGYYCTCGSLDYLGRCDGDISQYCDEGRLRRTNCRIEGLECGYVDAEIGFYCTDDPQCLPEDEGGRCEGTIAINCASGRTTRIDCALDGYTCSARAGGARCESGIPDAGVIDAAGEGGGGGRCGICVLPREAHLGWTIPLLVAAIIGPRSRNRSGRLRRS